MKYPYLVQRCSLKQYYQGMRVGEFVNLDYMGSAEFEFGAFAQAIRNLHAADCAIGSTINIPSTQGVREEYINGEKYELEPTGTVPVPGDILIKTNLNIMKDMDRPDGIELKVLSVVNNEDGYKYRAFTDREHIAPADTVIESGVYRIKARSHRKHQISRCWFYARKDQFENVSKAITALANEGTYDTKEASYFASQFAQKVSEHASKCDFWVCIDKNKEFAFTLRKDVIPHFQAALGVSVQYMDSMKGQNAKR